MSCLSNEQIASLVLRSDSSRSVAAHVDECPTCQSRLATVRLTDERLLAAHVAFDREHEAARDRLMVVLKTIDQPEPAKSWRRVTHWIGAMTMRQRLAITSVGIAALLAIVALWGHTQPVSAMERMAENIRQAKSYKFTMVTEAKLVREPGQPPVAMEGTSTVYWLAPKSYRMEHKAGSFIAARDLTEIFPSGMSGIEIDLTNKTFRRTPAHLGSSTPLLALDELSTFSGQADGDLGTKQLDGRTARGFEIDARKIDPNQFAGPVEIWVDAQTSLPMLLRWEIKASPVPGVLVMRDFEWNLDLDPKLFDPVPPEGYRDVTFKPRTIEERIGDLVASFKIYAELSGGHYPRAKNPYGDVLLDEMLRMIGIHGQPTRDEARSDKYVKVQSAVRGFAELSVILRDNPDAAYHGATVGPKDADKVLFRWKLDDGRYQVLYGNLRAETVTAERLRELERAN
jgi:outer membrane lipoprotein-sorting protein